MLLGHEADVEEAHHLPELHGGALHRPQRGDDLLGGLEVAALERLLAALLGARDVGRARAELARRLAGREAGNARGAGQPRGRDPVLGHRGEDGRGRGSCLYGVGTGVAAARRGRRRRGLHLGRGGRSDLLVRRLGRGRRGRLVLVRRRGRRRGRVLLSWSFFWSSVGVARRGLRLAAEDARAALSAGHRAACRQLGDGHEARPDHERDQPGGHRNTPMPRDRRLVRRAQAERVVAAHRRRPRRAAAARSAPAPSPRAPTRAWSRVRAASGS